MWGPERESDVVMTDRAVRLLHWLAARPEPEIAVVTHNSLLRMLFDEMSWALGYACC